MNESPLIGIRCLAYNHEKTIRQTLDGFVKQETDFKFNVVIHDDASTDITPEIIKEYAEKYPDLIKPIFEEKNIFQNSPKGTLRRIMDDATNKYKYIALCEGDDYWISPQKLQRQISFLESHPEYSMCCCDAVIITPDGEQNWSISDSDIDLTVDDIVKGGGLYVPTAGIVYRKSVKDDYPLCCINCHVGDYPLQIMCSLKGKVRYFSDKMVAYRYVCGNSWTANNQKRNYNEKIGAWISELDMLDGLDQYSNKIHHRCFMERQLTYIFECAFNYPDNAGTIMDKLISHNPECVNYANIKDKLKIFVIRHNLASLWKKIRRIKGKP